MRLYKLLGGMLLSATFNSVLLADDKQSSLLQIAQEIHCTQTEQKTVGLINKLAQESTEPFGLPDESLHNQANLELYAATVDILLNVLYETIQRYPKLQTPIEKMVLNWNFCAVVNEGDLADLSVTEKKAVKQAQAIGPFPAKQQGFGIWGFIQRDAAKRYVPEIYKTLSPFPAAYQDFIHKLTQKQCIPHPVLEHSIDHKPYTGAYRLPKSKLMAGKQYPYTWDEHCPDQSPKKETAPKVEILKTITKAPIIKSAPKPVHKPYTPQAEAKKPSPPNNYQPEIAPAVVPIIVHKPEQAPKTPPAPINKPTAKVIPPLPKDKTLTEILTSTFKVYKQPTSGEISVIIPAIQPNSATGNAGIPPTPQSPNNGTGLSGNFYHSSRLNGELAFGGNISYKILSYFQLNCGGSYGYEPNTGDFRYACNIGYDDWHPGTFSTQLPLFDQDGWTVKNFTPSLGYKFDSAFLKSYNLSASASIAVPIATGDPILSSNLQWSPVEHWFIRAGIQKSFGDNGAWSWSYGFGYSDWRPFKVSLTYDNWGYNPVFDGKPGNGVNFVENGVISLSWGWAF